MMPLLKLFRLPNLLLIAVLQYFLRLYFIGPMLQSFGLELLLDDLQFFLLVLMTLSIVSAGYIINDYFDLKMDYINRIESEVIIGTHIKRRTAMLLHIVLSALGVLIGAYLAFSLGIAVLILAPIFIVGLLWFYSTDYKRQFLIGNIVLSFLAVVPVLFTLLYEPALFKAYFSVADRAIASLIFKVVLYFSSIVFGLSMVYAIIKDLHDMPGDEAVNARTLPIVVGESIAKMTVTFVSVAVLAALFYIQNMQYLNDAYIPLMYIIFCIELPLIFINIYLYFSGTAKQYQLLLKLCYLLMITGTFSILVLNFFSGS